jgi:hypothetical protein
MLYCIRVDQVLKQPTVHSDSAGDGGHRRGVWVCGSFALARRAGCGIKRAPRQQGAALLWGRRASNNGDDDGDDDLLRARAVIFVVVRGTTAEA